MDFDLKTPLARASLDDPAFSSDPRSHPHFPLANARSYKALPPKSPRAPPPLPKSPTSPSQTRGVSPIPPTPPPQRPLLVPDIPPKSHNTNTVLKPLRTNIPRKARIKAFVRRLTTRHNLDRIDELDETDPFGGSYHHDGPYESIGTNLAQPSLPRTQSNTAPRGGNIHHPRRESDPHPSRPSQYQSAHWVPSARDAIELSLHLEPGQILQQNTIYTSHLSSITTVSSPFLPRSDTVSSPTPSRPQSLPYPRTHHHEDPSLLDSRDGFPTRRSSLPVPRGHHLRDRTPDVPNNTPFHHDHSSTPYVLHQTENTVFPPPRYQSRLHNLSPPRSPQRTPPPSSNHMSLKTQATEYTAPALHSRHKTVHSLNRPHTINNTSTQSSAVQDKPLDISRIRHLPKRLVMPTPLQPRPPQSQYNFSPAEPPAWQDAYSDNYTLEGTRFEGQPAMYSQEPRLLRKKSSAFPAKTPIPDHVVVSQDDAVSKMANSSAKTANDVEGTKERTRRRKLSKRRNDT